MVVSGRDADRLQHAVQELEARGAAVHGVVADAAKREDADRLVDAAKERFGRLDILVNNAGITRDGLLIRMKDDDWDRVMEVNLRGAFLMTRAAAKLHGPAEERWSHHQHRLHRRRHGQRRAGRTTRRPRPASSGSPKRRARELAHWGILVNAVAPGLIETDMAAAIPAEAREALLAQVPLKRIGTRPARWPRW